MDSTSIVNHLLYDAFGQVTSESNPTVDSLFLFTARPFDSDTQLQNNLNRWYDPAVGTWLSEDPIGYPAELNLYGYCANNPLYRTDALGLAPADPLSFDGSIMALVRAGWSAEDIARAAGITVAAAEAYIYRVEIANAAQNIIKSLTAAATAANSGDPRAAAIAARKAAERSIASYETLITQHQAKIAEPLKYMTHPYPGFTQSENIAIAIADWTKQIAMFQKNIDTYRIALAALKKAEYCACWRWYKPWTWF